MYQVMELTEHDEACFRRTLALAALAEQEGNLPIGAVISLDEQIVAEGRNAIWKPHFNPNRHAEIEVLRSVPEALQKAFRRMTMYTTLEPCLMCTGAILLHRLGRVIYGAADDYGGASRIFGHMPVYFERAIARTEWIGPAFPKECAPLFSRVMRLVEARHADEE
jgi:tRNA(adenine34) deaminase